MARTKPVHDWPRIITHQKESGFSMADFCSLHKISPSSFKLNKQRLAKSSGFVQAKIAPLSKPANQAIDTHGAITLNTQVGQLSLPESISPSFIVDIIKGLS